LQLEMGTQYLTTLNFENFNKKQTVSINTNITFVVTESYLQLHVIFYTYVILLS
jgi:hypothetical protein